MIKRDHRSYMRLRLSRVIKALRDQRGHTASTSGSSAAERKDPPTGWRTPHWLASRFMAFACVLSLLLWSNSAAAPNQVQPSWQIEVVDDGDGHDVGMYSSLAIDRDGDYQLAYYDSTNKALLYGFRRSDDQHWSKMLVDRDAGTFVSLALDLQGRPHMAYNSDRGLRYAVWTDGRWRIQTIDPVPTEFFTAIQLDRQGNPRLTYFELPSSRAQGSRTQKGGFERLKYAYFNGSAWFTETIVEQSTQEPFDSLAIDAAGDPYVVYAEFARLRYAYARGSQWIFESIEPPLHQHVISGLSIAMDAQDNPYVAYFDDSRKALNLVARTEETWKSEVVDELVSAPVFPGSISLKLDSQSQPHVTYSDSGAGLLKYAARKNGKWTIEVIDQQATDSTCPSLSLDSRDQPFISYYDSTGRQLRLARLFSDAKARGLDTKPANQSSHQRRN